MKLCICGTMAFIFRLCRLFGLLPISWSHVNNHCHYRVSKPWIVYTIILAIFMSLHIIKIFPSIMTPFTQDRSLLLAYIGTLNENIISVFILILMIINLIRAPGIVKVYNSYIRMQQEDLLCQLSLKNYLITHLLFIVLMCLQYFIQFGAIFAFDYIDAFGSEWNYERFIMPIIHNTSFLFYSIFGSTCTLTATMLACYETKIRRTLKYEAAHPIKDFVKNVITYPFYWRHNVCKNSHDGFQVPLQSIDKLEYLQCLFNDFQQNLTDINDAFNPQLLLHISNELIVMIFHWYAVIVYFTYDKVSPSDNTNNFFHWYYVAVHSWALFVSMSMSQQIETKIQGFKCIFLEYSTTVSTVEEYHMVRNIVQQLHNYKGFTASGIFTVNLQILAPICANVLMYVLVAIQFKFPKKDTF